MAFLEELDKRRKWDTMVTITAIGISALACILVTYWAVSFAARERHRIYVLDGDTPLTAVQTDETVTEDIEAKAHVNLFHSLFFTLAPDDKYIQNNLEKSMYLIDESGLAQRNALQEQGFYNNIISASANFAIVTDSILYEPRRKEFVYYGRQRIERRTSVLYRLIVTQGNVMRTTRTENNPFGFLITNYRTLRNEDLELKNKSAF